MIARIAPSTPKDAGPRKRRSAEIAIITNTIVDLAGMRKDGMMYGDVRLDIRLGRSLAHPSKSRQGQSGRIG
jgi:hypothetical protein